MKLSLSLDYRPDWTSALALTESTLTKKMIFDHRALTCKAKPKLTIKLLFLLGTSARSLLAERKILLAKSLELCTE